MKREAIHQVEPAAVLQNSSPSSLDKIRGNKISGAGRAKILEIFKRVMGNIIETIAVVGKRLAPDGGKIDTALIPQFNMMFGKATESTAAGIAKEYNVTPMVSGWWCGWCWWCCWWWCCCCCIGGVG